MTTGYYMYGVADYSVPRRANGQPHILKHRLRVEVLFRGDAWATVRFLEWHVDGRGPGTVTRVRNRSVRCDDNYINPPAVPYRMPYKDD
jgi:hypothetical protein